jgi:hypothetical protein
MNLKKLCIISVLPNTNLSTLQNAMQKVDSIIKDNPGVSLDDLTASRKINADQKAQALKKPHLQAQLANFEEQLAIYKKLDAEYQGQLAKDMEALQTAHAEELEKVRAEAKADALNAANKQAKMRLLSFSRFLAAAANRRNIGEDSSDEGRAFEGALLLVYGGDVNAVEAALKIIDGVNEKVTTVDGALVDVTCKFTYCSPFSLLLFCSPFF